MDDLDRLIYQKLLEHELNGGAQVRKLSRELGRAPGTIYNHLKSLKTERYAVQTTEKKWLATARGESPPDISERHSVARNHELSIAAGFAALIPYVHTSASRELELKPRYKVKALMHLKSGYEQTYSAAKNARDHIEKLRGARRGVANLMRAEDEFKTARQEVVDDLADQLLRKPVENIRFEIRQISTSQEPAEFDDRSMKSALFKLTRTRDFGRLLEAHASSSKSLPQEKERFDQEVELLVEKIKDKTEPLRGRCILCDTESGRAFTESELKEFDEVINLLAPSYRPFLG